MLHRSLVGLAVCTSIALVAGCGGSVDVEPSPSGGGGASASSSSSSASDVSASNAGSVASSSASVGAGGAGGAPSCALTNDALTLNLETFDGEGWGCGPGFEVIVGDYALDAMVVASDFNEIVLDSCPPDGDCAPMLSTLSIAAPDLYPQIEVGTFVHLDLHVDVEPACTQRVFLWNLPSFGGARNPIYPFRFLLLAAGDGSLDLTEPSPFTLSAMPLDCPLAPGDPARYALRFTDAKAPELTTVVAMGETETFFFEGSQLGYWLVRDLRSYKSGAPDDGGNWAYWLAWSNAIK